MNAVHTRAEGRDLVLSMIIDAAPARVYQAWTDPTLICQWFTPPPWRVARAELDVRAGGASLIVMVAPDGKEFPNRGVFLEVVPEQRLVFTDAYVQGWEPSAKPFMTVILSFEPFDGRTRYTAVVRHWTEADRQAHEQMGFHQGWAQTSRQLAALVQPATR
jgi:uncharacterized protein YndB with AHSA1/START domain